MYLPQRLSALYIRGHLHLRIANGYLLSAENLYRTSSSDNRKALSDAAHHSHESTRAYQAEY